MLPRFSVLSFIQKRRLTVGSSYFCQSPSGDQCNKEGEEATERQELLLCHYKVQALSLDVTPLAPRRRVSERRSASCDPAKCIWYFQLRVFNSR